MHTGFDAQLDQKNLGRYPLKPTQFKFPGMYNEILTINLCMLVRWCYGMNLDGPGFTNE